MKTFELVSGLKTERNQYHIKDSAYILERREFLFPTHGDAQVVNGFIDYICYCYKNHYSATISPTDIMYMVQAELATAIKKNPDAFASMFTTTPGTKQEIITLTGNPEEIDVYAVVDVLKTRVPTNVDLFLPRFSTDTISSVFSSHVAFCDMVSPYYNYSTLLCGIPRIEIAGELEDWQKLAKSLFDISALFSGNLKTYLARVWSRVTEILRECTYGDGSMFKSMVSMEPCGSGSQYEITGWILEFMNTSDTPPIMLQNVHPHVSKMEYKNLDTGRTFELLTGIFYCKFNGDVARPQYNAVRIETTGGVKTKTKKPELKIYSEPLVAPTKKIPQKFSIEMEQDLQAFYSPNAENALLAALEKKKK